MDENDFFLVGGALHVVWILEDDGRRLGGR